MNKLQLEENVKCKYEALVPIMNERMKRRWAAAEAKSIGYGGISIVSRATGLSRTTITSGIQENEAPSNPSPDRLIAQRIRQTGGGRKSVTDHDPTVIALLEDLVDPVTRGDPESPLRWTCKSLRNLAKELHQQGCQISEMTVSRLLKEMGYSLQANRRTQEGKQHPDRNAQFEYINRKVLEFQKRRQPVVSVDTKKKELVGNFANSGREWRPQGAPEEVNVHDFPDNELGKAIPYGVYDLSTNQGWVSVGIDHDTAQFATATLLNWWENMGRLVYPKASELLITADSGGSNSSRSRLWKVALQDLSDQMGLRITVCHFPPGTSKWNKIEHRMFSHITENWRGQPLRSRSVIVNLIGSTTTKKGLRIHAALDTNKYETGIKITDEKLACVNLKKANFHGEWNYTILPYV
jgi:transposase